MHTESAIHQLPKSRRLITRAVDFARTGASRARIRTRRDSQAAPRGEEREPHRQRSRESERKFDNKVHENLTGEAESPSARSLLGIYGITFKPPGLRPRKRARPRFAVYRETGNVSGRMSVRGISPRGWKNVRKISTFDPSAGRGGGGSSRQGNNNAERGLIPGSTLDGTSRDASTILLAVGQSS